MCGRYGLYDLSEEDRIKPNQGYKFKPNYNVAPSQEMPVVISDTGVELVTEMKWGIHRHIGPTIEKDIINTRADKAFTPFWSKMVHLGRCLIPANGFYEWKTTAAGKFPYWIHPKDQGLFYFAGIFKDGQYSIMTTEPNKEMKEIHNRMPVILSKNEREAWLNAENEDEIGELLHPYQDGGLELYRVSKEVNSPRNNYKELLSAE